MTVSRALHNSPHVTPETRDRILRIAKRLRYAPDPHMARLMAMIRSVKQRRISAVIGLIRDDLLDDELHDPAYQYIALDDIRQRALRHGYLVEEFLIGRNGVEPRRLQTILEARGIEGLVISPQSSRVLASQLDYTPFAAATLGYGMASPALHRVSANMTEGILIAMQELAVRGYRRVGIAITDWIDARSGRTYSGGLLYHQAKLPRRERVPMLFFRGNNPKDGQADFMAWMRKYRPDAVISFHTYVPEWITQRLGLRVPEDIGLLVHDWHPRMTAFAGIFHRRPDAAATAVDLVATQLIQNERGVPAVPKQILVPPAWVDGPTLRPRGARTRAAVGSMGR